MQEINQASTNLEILKKQFDENILAQSYILYGQEQELIFQTAIDLAAYIFFSDISNGGYFSSIEAVKKHMLSGIHPNFFLLQPEVYGKEILVEYTRNFIDFLKKTPRFPGWRIVIINYADFLNVSSSNAILKILEEPPAKTCIFFVVQSLARIKATILSRSQKVFFPTNFKTIKTFAETNDKKMVQNSIKEAIRRKLPSKIIVEKIANDQELYNSFPNIALETLHELALHFLQITEEGSSTTLELISCIKKYEKLANFITESQGKSLSQSSFIYSVFVLLGK